MRVSTLATRNSEGGGPYFPSGADRCPGTPLQDFTLRRIQAPDTSSLHTPRAGPQCCGESLSDSRAGGWKPRAWVGDGNWDRGWGVLLISMIKGVTQLERADKQGNLHSPSPWSYV